MMDNPALILALAFITDLLLGDPAYPFHPVRLIGKWSALLETFFFKLKCNGFIAGVFFWLFSVSLPALILFFIWTAAKKLHLEWLNIFLAAFFLYSFFAFRDMLEHVKPLYVFLKEKKLEKARTAISKIVGRDTAGMDREAIIRASIESTAESFVDAFFSPLIFFTTGYYIFYLLGFSGCVFGGLLFTLLYRCANTLDSMVGYRNEKYEYFGKFAARVDDALNFVPARLSVFFLGIGAFVSGLSLKNGLSSFLHFRLQSKSPNAAHTMGFFAGAIGIKLGGPAQYSGKILNKPWIGSSAEKPDVGMIQKAVKLFYRSGVCVFIILEALFLITTLLFKG